MRHRLMMLLVLAGGLAAVVTPGRGISSNPPTTEFVLLATSAIYGELVPCG